MGLADDRQADKDLIRKYAFKGYGDHEDILPSGICYGFRMRLSSLESSKPVSMSSRLYDSMVQDLSSLHVTWSDCVCELWRLCTSAYHRGKLPKTKYHSSNLHKAGRPVTRANPSQAQKSATAVNVCSYCHTQMVKGKSHSCGKGTKLQNLLQSCSAATKGKVACSILREKVKNDVSSKMNLSRSIWKMARDEKVLEKAIRRVVKEDLNVLKSRAKWRCQVLTEVMQAKRVTCHRHLLNFLKNKTKKPKCLLR